MRYCPECGQRLPPPVTAPTGYTLRRFEFRDWSSRKFWEIWLTQRTVFTRYGRIGTSGTTVQKEFSTSWQAAQYRLAKITEKRNKGYREVV